MVCIYLKFRFAGDRCVSDTGTHISPCECVLELDAIPIFDISTLHSLLPCVVLCHFHLNISLCMHKKNHEGIVNTINKEVFECM